MTSFQLELLEVEKELLKATFEKLVNIEHVLAVEGEQTGDVVRMELAAVTERVVEPREATLYDREDEAKCERGEAAKGDDGLTESWISQKVLGVEVNDDDEADVV